jgi:hypothetical protein
MRNNSKSSPSQATYLEYQIRKLAYNDSHLIKRHPLKVQKIFSHI